MKCKEKLEMSTVGVGSLGAYSFLPMLQEISRRSGQSTDDTFNLVFFSQGDRVKCLRNGFFLVGPANNAGILEITAI